MDIKPVMLLFFTPFKVDVDKHTLKPYMAAVNHNVIYRNCDVLPIDYDLLIVMFVVTIILMLNKILRVCLF